MACVAPGCTRPRSGDRMFCDEHLQAHPAQRFYWCVDHADGFVVRPPPDRLKAAG